MCARDTLPRLQAVLTHWDADARVLEKNALGRSALTEALHRGHADLARDLLAHRSAADVDVVGEGAEEETDEEVGDEAADGATAADGAAAGAAAGAGAGAGAAMDM